MSPYPVATTISAAEQAILTRLRDVIAARGEKYGADVWPSSIETYRPKHPRGEFLILYAGAAYTAPDDIDAVVQRRALRFDITAVCRQLSGHESVYVMLDFLRRGLTGYRVPGFGPLVPTREAVTGYKEGTWYMTLSCEIAGLAIQADDVNDPLDAPPPVLLTRVSVTGDSTLEIPAE